jgi:F-type H+-transporting ATPase subunit gamma
MSLKTIKTKIRSVIKTGKVTTAMEAVSAAKMRKAQSRAIAGRAYARAAVSVLARVAGSKEINQHPLTRRDTGGAALYIVITSDKGLAGALNSAVLRLAALTMHKGDAVLAIGRKAHDFFVSRGVTELSFYPNTDHIDTDSIVALVQKEFENKKFNEVWIVYQNFISTFEQKPTKRMVFPLHLQELSEVVKDIVPVKGVFANAFENEVQPHTYTIEPSESEVLNTLLPMLASVFVYHALLESQASEHSARMVAMKSASDKADEMTHALTLRFNKARQAAITREVSEITAGMEAMI